MYILHLRLHLGGVKDGHNTVKLKGEIGVVVTVAVILVEIVFINQDVTDLDLE